MKFKMKKIYFVLTYTGTILSKIIKLYTKKEYSHVSIALDQDLKYMYSFGRLNPYNAFIGGFVHEEIDKGTFKRFKNTKSLIYDINVTDSEYNRIIKNICEFEKNKEKYHFNIKGLFAAGFNKKITKDNYFYCAEFLKFILDESGININLPEIIKPEDFENVKNKNIIYKGYLKNYNYRLAKLYENQVAC